MMIEELGNGAIDTTLFDSAGNPFADSILRTTWEELVRQGYVERIGASQYRLTAKGWLAAVQLVGVAESSQYKERLGKLLATMKGHVKGREESKVVELRTLASQCNEPEGWIFNVIDSRASSSIGGGRTGAKWFENERGRLVEIPVDFNLEPIDIAEGLTVPHLEKIQELEERIEEIEEDRSQFHCPYCDAPISGITGQDFPEYHCYVTYENFECGYVTEDGFERSPCPYGPKWPQLEEFDFVTRQHESIWICSAIPKTARAKRAGSSQQFGKTKEEAEERARRAVAPKKKGDLPHWD